MDPSEGGDLERVFNICDTDGDGLLSKEELESILKDIGVEHADINEFMWGLQAEEYITYSQFVYAIEKFRLQSTNSGSTLSFHGSRVSPRSQAGSAAGGDHAECNFAIHDLNSKNSILSKQVYSLEAQIHELVQQAQDQGKTEKLQAKELRKLHNRFSSVSAELEVLKQINKDVTSRESDLKRQLKAIQDQKTGVEHELHTARGQLESARSGENALRNALQMDAGIVNETQVELTRLADALERSEAEVLQLMKANEELMKMRRDDEYQIKVLDARIERLNLEVENKDTLFAELGLVPDTSGHVHDKLGNTWHGFRTVSPLFSELGQIQNEPVHPSLVDDRNLQVIGKSSLDSAFLKEKVANLNEEIRRRAPAVHRHASGPIPSQSDEAGDSDVAFSSSLSENDKPEPHEKGSDDQNDLVTNQLMNLSDLVITTSDITHSECSTPTYHRDSASTPNGEKDSSSTSPIPASDATVGTEDGDADKEDGESESEIERETETETEKGAEREEKISEEPLTSPHESVERVSTPTPSHTFGVSPDEAHQRAKDLQIKQANEIEKKQAAEQPNGKINPRRNSADHESQLQNGQTTPRSAASTDRSSSFVTPYSQRSTPKTTPRQNEELASSRSAPTTFRSEDPNTDTTPRKAIKHSKSEVIRTKLGSTPAKVLEAITPIKTPVKRELVRHKSDVSLYNSGLGSTSNSSPGSSMLEKVTPDQANELHEFALRAGLLRPRPDFSQKLDKYAQVTPADLDEVVQASRTRSQRNVASTPHSAHSTNTLSTPKTSTARSARTPASAHEMHHVDRKIVVRGHTYLVRLLSHPDPALDDLEDTVKKLEAELIAIEERFNKPAAASSVAPLSSTSSLTPLTSASSLSSFVSGLSNSSSVPVTPPPKGGARTPRTPSAAPPLSPSPSSSSLSSSHHTFTNRRTLRPSPLVTSTSIKSESKFKNWKFWVLASLGVVLSLLLMAFIVSSKLQAVPTTKVEL